MDGWEKMPEKLDAAKEVLADLEASIRQVHSEETLRELRAVAADLREALGLGLPKEPGAGLVAARLDWRGAKENEFRRLSDGSWVSREDTCHDDAHLLRYFKVVRVL